MAQIQTPSDFKEAKEKLSKIKMSQEDDDVGIAWNPVYRNALADILVDYASKRHDMALFRHSILIESDGYERGQYGPLHLRLEDRVHPLLHVLLTNYDQSLVCSAVESRLKEHITFYKNELEPVSSVQILGQKGDDGLGQGATVRTLGKSVIPDPEKLGGLETIIDIHAVGMEWIRNAFVARSVEIQRQYDNLAFRTGEHILNPGRHKMF